MTIINYELRHRDGDKTVRNTCEEFAEELRSLRDSKLRRCLGYPPNGSIEIRSKPSPNNCMTLSFSDTKLENAPPGRYPFATNTNDLRKSFSEPGERNRLDLDKRKKSNASGISASRRPSRLGKLPLFGKNQYCLIAKCHTAIFIQSETTLTCYEL